MHRIAISRGRSLFALIVVTGGVDNAAGLVFLSSLHFGLSLVAGIPVRWFVGWLTLTFIELFTKNLDGVKEVAGNVFDPCISYRQVVLENRYGSISCARDLRCMRWSNLRPSFHSQCVGCLY